MIDRGDLAVETSIDHVALYQKKSSVKRLAQVSPPLLRLKCSTA